MSESLKVKDEGNAKYARKEYWNERYEAEEEYDWLGNYSTVRSLIREWIPNQKDRILMLGCGNSSLSKDMYLDGYTNIVNIDISEVCIERMRESHQSTPMEWKVADVTNLGDFENESFDAVVEKATLDALLVNEKSAWNISEEGEAKVGACLSEASRVMKNSGAKFLSFTFSPLHLRAPVFAKERYNWSVTHRSFGNENGFPYSCFVMVKGESLCREFTDKFTNLTKLKIEPFDEYSSSSCDEDFVSRIELDSASDNSDNEDSNGNELSAADN